MKKFSILIVCAAALLVLIGCSQSGTTAESETQGAGALDAASGALQQTKPDPLRIVDSGYTVTEKPSRGQIVEFGLLVNNTNAAFVAYYPKIRVTMTDENGEIIGTHDEGLSKILPGETVAWAGEARTGGRKPAKVEFDPIMEKISWKSTDFTPYKTFQFDCLAFNQSETGITFTGELLNPNPESFKQVAVSIILRDAGGKIVVGYKGFVVDVPANGRVPFQVKSPGRPPQSDKYEAHATVWSQ